MPELQGIKHEEEDPLQARSISSPWNPVYWRLAKIMVELKTTARLLHSTNNKEENIKVWGRYKHKYWVGIIGQLKIENSIYQVI